MMKEELKFEDFFDRYGSEFTEYLSSISTPDTSAIQYRKLMDEVNEVYTKYPNVKAVMDGSEARSLTVEECKGLITVVEDRDVLWGLGNEKIYFQGCADSIGYMRKLKMLKGQPD